MEGLHGLSLAFLDLMICGSAASAGRLEWWFNGGLTNKNGDFNGIYHLVMTNIGKPWMENPPMHAMKFGKPSISIRAIEKPWLC